MDVIYEFRALFVCLFVFNLFTVQTCFRLLQVRKGRQPLLCRVLLFLSSLVIIIVLALIDGLGSARL